MAANVNTTKRRYDTPGVVNGSLAHKLEPAEHEQLRRRLEKSGQLDFDQAYKERKATEAELIARQRAKVKAATRPHQKVSVVMVAGFAAAAVMLVCLLMCYVQINAISSNIVSMKSQIGDLEVEQVELLTKYEQVFDLATVKEKAQAAGMVQPGESQTYYIQLPGQDQAVSYAAREPGLFSGILASFSQRLDSLVEYFR